MPTPIEQALITLLPTLPTIPPPLLSLSTSLLAHSRACCPNLKPDEEIARTFAVCHVAVLRLKVQLGIDRVNVKPPVPPRVYGRLVGYLESALGSGGTPKKTSRGTPRGTPGRRGGGGEGQGVDETPTSVRVRNEMGGGRSSPASVVATTRKTQESGGRTAASGGRRSTRLPPKTVDARPTRLSVRATPNAATTSDIEIPASARTMITAVCTTFSLPSAESHVLAACASVIATRGWTDTDSIPSAILSSPLLSRKRTRGSSHDAPDDTPQDSESRSRKRRRTGLATSTSTTTTTTPSIPTTQTPPTTGPITPLTLPSLIAALSLYTIFTLRNQDLNGPAFDLATAQAVAAIESTFTDSEPAPDTEVMKGQIGAFMQALHKEGSVSQEWAGDVRAEVDVRRRGLDEGDVEMDEAGEGAEGLGGGLDGYQDGDEEGGGDEQEDQSEEEARRPHRRTPRKSTTSSSRPAKTPLRRREKHAPRPTTAQSETDPLSSNRAGLKSGLGTMFQDAVDWLSAERCADYGDWKTWIEREISRIEQEDGTSGSRAVAVVVA